MAAPRSVAPVLSALALLVAAACGGSKDAAPANNAASAAGNAPAAASNIASATGSASDSIGRQVFMTCTTCHQATGLGIPGTYPPLAGSEIANGPVELPIAIVLKGLNGPITVEGKTFNNVMTPWGPVFNDTQIAAVLTYVRSQWGNTGGPVTAEQVAAVRAKTSSRTTMWTWAELKAFKF